ncbi:FAD dependent oxidoreductase [Fusarium flagelliforme]|uniref:FAD dependent oxidoreductase n=1 Tax=Fusarium flagelliforme TaxID=2675880 RepID=UPI001E8CFBD8|nr:FAD dependent oxidoreductase [Fusarium flagelliforme]KAH7184931.1 FAD dependent oxidoreductase [Fusarium flagelliforme]
MSVAKSEPILIVGGGAFGLSTVVHLLKAGYKDITVLDKDDEIPSRWSAANDLNKIVRAEYEDPLYQDLTVKAIRAWQTPFFAPHFHQVGFLHCVSGNAPKEAHDTLNRFRAAAERDPRLKPHLTPLNSQKDIADAAWQYNESSFPGWTGYFNRFDGYANSGSALRSIYQATKAQGVKYILGTAGVVSEIVYENTSSGRKAKGAKTTGGLFYPSKFVVISVGAAGAKLVPEIGKQLVAKSWSVAHLHLTDDETAALRGIPVTYARDLGFFFEPDPKTNLLKLCPMGGGFINTDPKTGVSHAPTDLKQSAFLPGDDDKQLRELVRQTLPQFSDRPFVKKNLCWFADTVGSDFIIDYVPNTSSSVLFLSGDSGHGFKFFPIFGEWVKDLLESDKGEQPVARWRWKNPKTDEKQGDWGGAVSWRLGNSKELVDIQPAGHSKL